MTTAVRQAADWPAVAARLAERDDLAAGDLLTLLQRPNPLLRPPVDLFCVLAASCDQATLRSVLEEHSASPATLAGWLSRTARIALRTFPKPDPPVVVPHPIGPVHVDEHVDQLDLLTLAGDQALARMRPLVVRAVDLGPLAAGRHRRAVRATIAGQAAVVDVIDLNPTDRDPIGTWLHELSHYLDPRIGERSPEGTERFADRLAELLWEHFALYLDRAQRLIERADEAASKPPPLTAAPVVEPAPPVVEEPAEPLTSADLPAEGLPSLAVLANLLGRD